MFTQTIKTLRLLPVAAAIAALAGFPAIASAQQPSYATPSYANRAQTISGTVQRFDGQWTMYVADKNGYVDTVSLHQGTAINPTGIALQPGFPVMITGYSSGSVFVANVINTPVRYAPRFYGYYPYPYWGPYYRVGFFYRPYRWWR